MSNLRIQAVFLLLVLAAAVWSIFPLDKKIRLGKDLAGGVSLVYGVDVKHGDAGDILSQVATNVKSRLDPGGALEVSVQPMGTDRIEIEMPLPTAAVNQLKQNFEDELAKVGTASLTRDELERIGALPEGQRATAIASVAGDKDRQAKIELAIQAFQAKAKARAEYEPAQQQVKFIQDRIRDAGGENSQDPIVAGLKDALKKAKEQEQTLLSAAAKTETAYDEALKTVVTPGLNAGDLRRALILPDQPIKLLGKDGKVAELDSPRKRALSEIEQQFPTKLDEINKVVAKWNEFESKRTGLDDPQDVVKTLKGAGVLTFRIAVRPGVIPSEQDLRQQLRQGGPRAVKFDDAHFYRVNKIEQWVDSVDQLEALKKSAPAYFQSQRNLIGEEYKGSYYILCWDKRGMRLTPEDGSWQLTKAYQGADQLGRPAIDFQMDVLGGKQLGRLTGANRTQAMAVLLDDEVYTAPTLQSEISNNGQITGSFSQPEIDYITKVLSAGSLKAKLSQEPLNMSVVGPSLGADNLHKSFETGVVAFVLVAGFMIVYYFTSGLIAVIALIFNCLLVVAAMAANQSAFTLPGIAGVVLTFGQAVDANVLIYERMREELQLGHDLRTSARLGFSRALAPIVDGNVSNLIICVVLGFFGTEEIRGFAVTLGIGVVTTLFSTLFFTRFIFNVLIEKCGWRHTSQLPMSVPMVQRIFSPHIDWMKHRWGHLSLLVAFLAVSTGIVIHQGRDLLGMEFRAGTAVTLTFKKSKTADGKETQFEMKRNVVEDKVKEIAASAPAGSPLKDLEHAQVIAVNPESDNITSGTFTVKSLVTDQKLIHDALVAKFIDNLDARQALAFTGSNLADHPERAPVYPITGTDLAGVIERPGTQGAIPPEFVGGAAIVLDKLQPQVSLAQIEARLEATRRRPEFADASSRMVEVRVLEGSNAAVSSAVELVKDPEINFDARKRWESEMRDREWALAQSALSQAETLAGVESFSPAIARTFATQGIMCALLSLLGLTIYVFARFGTIRWAVAATLPLFADVIGIIGLLGVAQMLYNNPHTQGWAAKLYLLPFDLDLAQIAAVLTIVGYSLNDKIIILDRIRENKGKLPYASAKVINDSINQTLSRTVITAGAHMITTIALYLFGGEAVRGFAFTFNLGVLLGTYTSIVSTPLVWSRKAEPTAPAGSALPGALRGASLIPGSNGDRAAVNPVVGT